MTDQFLLNQVAIITGAARGIGFEIASQLAQAGARVAVLDVHEAEAKTAAQLLCDGGYEAIGLGADVRYKDQVLAAIQVVIDQWKRIDVLINNAGICPVTPFPDISEAEWDLVLGVNLKGAFLCSQAVAPFMRRQQYGRIVNIASSAGQMGGLAVGLHYSSSKAGTLGLTKSLARILAPEIQVNAVAPGTTETSLIENWDQGAVANIIKQIPLKRLGQPSDVAGAVLFMVSPQAAFITGQTLSVNGGLLML
ncbi:2-hydroxycyclohexanecarboxyl-CoA dehydrogenase [Anaerolineales bacterium]|nr:2-hydroxycyclohexanecarboxyl-CoA dehydrogenase [Anaerolineales bacterium]